jgi:hypothetical protein
MIAIFLILIGLAALSFILLAPGVINNMAHSSTEERGRRIPPEMVIHRDKLYRECLVAAQEGRFEHDHLTYRLKGSDIIHGFTLTDETWAFGIQPYQPVNMTDGFSFTREQSKELAELLTPLNVGLSGRKAEKYDKAIRSLNGEEE